MQPVPYTVTYSFSDFQSNNPAAPLPAVQLDGQLGEIAAAMVALVSAIQDIRRADGKLNNGIVTFDSLAQGLQLLVDPTNGQLVAAAVAGAQASATAAGGSATAAAASAAAALANAIAAANSAATVNLSLYLAKANNLAGLGSQSTSRSNLGLGSVATFDVGAGANNIVQLDGGAKLPAYDGSQLINIDVLPVGTTIWVNAVLAPPGFLKENGVLLSRATFPRLWAFAAAGGQGNTVSEATWLAGQTGSFSTGDLATTFRIPDSRGEFIRAYDDGRGVDGGRGMGTHQADSLKDHTHPGTFGGAIVNVPVSSGAAILQPGATSTGSPSTGAAAETRPRNNAKLACIKY